MTFSRPGAVDLSALKQTRPAPGAPAGAPAGGAGGGSYVVDVTEADFQQVAIEGSLDHLVVLSLWSSRAPQSADFNAVLARVANELDGQILLAQVDVDTNPQIAQALGAQGVPLVVGLVKGQPVPLFQGTAEEADVRQYFTQLISLGAQHGVTGRSQPVGSAGPAPTADDEPAEDPRFAAADDAFGRGDYDAAVAEYERLLAQQPADTEVAERLAGTKLYARTQSADLQEARKAAADHPEDLAAQLLVADLDVSGGHVEDAFARLIDLVRRSAPDDREQVRERLLELFTVVGSSDPRVADARRALASALF